MALTAAKYKITEKHHYIEEGPPDEVALHPSAGADGAREIIRLHVADLAAALGPLDVGTELQVTVEAVKQ